MITLAANKNQPDPTWSSAWVETWHECMLVVVKQHVKFAAIGGSKAEPADLWQASKTGTKTWRAIYHIENQEMTNKWQTKWQKHDKQMTKKWQKNDQKMTQKCIKNANTNSKRQIESKKNDKKMTKKWQNNYFGFSNVCRSKIFLKVVAPGHFAHFDELNFPQP